jgi:beta-lactamase class A
MPAMKTLISRRTVLRAGLAAPVIAATPATPAVADSLRALEHQYRVRLGVFAENLCTGRRMAHRQHERFPMCSVFKPLAVAAVLRDLDHAGEVLNRRIYFTSEELVVHSPVTSQHLTDGMTVRELCDAAIRYGDNTAANLLLRLIGGPGGVTHFARTVGDIHTRLDRWEPELNIVGRHDPRDTTTPRAIATTYQRLLLGRALAPDDTNLLAEWMLDIQTGFTRLRAGLPQGWTLADKTGSGAFGVVNDVGIAWTPRNVPIKIAALSSQDAESAVGDDQLLADVARLVAANLG